MGQTTGGRGVIGKIALSLFLLPFLGVGLWFGWLMIQGMQRQWDSYFWPKLTCTILSSQVEENPGAEAANESYVFRIRYSYEADGAEGTSEAHWGSSDIGDALRLARTYPRGSQTPCWVNPAEPDSAKLELEPVWNVVFILFPLVFVAVGGGGIYAIWRNPTSKPSAIGTAISSRMSKSTAGPGCLAAFFSVFLLAGLAVFIPFFAVPLYDTLNASQWLEVPCRLEYSAVRTHPGDDGSTYSVDVLYSYRVEGETYKSSRYNFFGGSDGDYASKKEFVDSHPAGTETACWVNAADPLEAVLRRDYSESLLVGIVPLIFVLVGGGGMVWALKSGKRKTYATHVTSDGRTWRQPTDAPSSGRTVLKPAATPFTKLLTVIGIALFWNGITGVFVWLAITGWNTEDGAGCLAIFMIPFVLIGLLLLVGIPYQFLAMFNPRPELTLDPGRLVLGKGSELAWRFQGAAGRIRRLRITLEGTETVTYRRGTDTRTDSNTFAKIEALDLAPPHHLEAGQAYLSVPADTMHSFKAGSNKVVWKLKVHGEIRVWPDVTEEFEVQVEPA